MSIANTKGLLLTFLIAQLKSKAFYQPYRAKFFKQFGFFVYNLQTNSKKTNFLILFYLFLNFIVIILKLDLIILFNHHFH